MRESIHKYFQVGTIRWMSFPNRSVVDQVKRIAVDDYFDAIEVTKCADDAEREEVKKILEQSLKDKDLQVHFGAASPVELAKILFPGGELVDVFKAIADISGFLDDEDDDEEDTVKEVKN